MNAAWKLQPHRTIMATSLYLIATTLHRHDNHIAASLNFNLIATTLHRHGNLIAASFNPSLQPHGEHIATHRRISAA